MARYGLLAIDLDGTLYQPDGTIHEEDRMSVAMAVESGLRVVICTGRSRAEAGHAVEVLGLEGPMVTAGGAITVCAGTGRTLSRALISADRTGTLVREIHESGEAALLLKDRAAVGYDYLVVDGANEGSPGMRLDPVFDWWFRTQGLLVRRVGSVNEDEDHGHTVRVGAGGLRSKIERLHEVFSGQFGEECESHHFPAVSHAGRDASLPAGEVLHVLEAFAKEANKWSAVKRVAAGWGIAPSGIVAIGDQVNDVSMVGGAQRAGGLGVAMGNAVSGVREVAGRVTGTNVGRGVSAAIARVMNGEW